MTIHIGRSFIDQHFPKYSTEFKDSMFKFSKDSDRVLDGMISVDPFDVSPFTDDTSETWYVFKVYDNSLRQSKYDDREYKNNYRIVLIGIDDVLWEKYVDTKDDVYSFLDQFQFNSITNQQIREQFMWAN